MPDSLPEGKLPLSVLEKMLGSFRGNLVVSPHIGVDVGVSLIRGKYLVSSSDPITGTSENMAWHAVNVSANDVATSGIMPDILNIVALFPRKTRPRAIEKMMIEINRTASELGIAVAGGHTEITPWLERPIIMVTAMGSGDRFVTAAEARPFDSIIMTKTAAIEGTSILSRLPRVKKLVGTTVSKRGSSLLRELSIMKEAREAFETGFVHAMHDVTEGGVLGAVYEMSVASNLGFELFSERVPIDSSTKAICEKILADPLKLIGSGSLLISCAENSSQTVIDRLKSVHVPCSKIGRFLPLRKGRILDSGGKRTTVTEDSIQDELWRLLGEYGNFS